MIGKQIVIALAGLTAAASSLLVAGGAAPADRRQSIEQPPVMVGDAVRPMRSEPYLLSDWRGAKVRLAIDPTAQVHPSVILEGKVVIGAYTKIDAGTVITGDVVIGHHSLIRCNVTIRGSNQQTK